MKNFLKTFNPTFNYYKMKNKTLFNSLLFTFAFIGSLFAIEKPLKASVAGPVCPDPSTTTINSVFDPSDPSGSFIGLTGGYGGGGDRPHSAGSGAGTANTGGGGAGSRYNTPIDAGAGGKGIVIIRYKYQ